ncbi:MAG: tyrosine-protein phosphatase [Novosphingobium sp.]|jgi:protein-tyrosine phosphatase|nr:tyrosine-protein phosphatase [Novosphingobium sp.]
MTRIHRLIGLSALALLAAGVPAFARADRAAVERTAADRVTVGWTAAGPVDVFIADRPVSDPAAAQPVAADDRTGRVEVAVDSAARPYFLLRDKADGSLVPVAERVVPLTQGSNFRDIGGYAGADGRHVRWGLIYRSGATPLLTADDLARIHALGLVNMIDLRSSEERELAPTKIHGVIYSAVAYSMEDMMKMAGQGAGPTGGLYRAFPKMLVPQLRDVFNTLMENQGPIVYNCSAGQDRTGFTTAMVLAALGVPRDTILADYHLSTAYRHPRWEMPVIDPAAFPGNRIARFFASHQDPTAERKPEPLYDRDGKSLLLASFAEIDRRYGSVDAYLEKEVGVTAADLATLRANYLE